MHDDDKGVVKVRTVPPGAKRVAQRAGAHVCAQRGKSARARVAVLQRRLPAPHRLHTLEGPRVAIREHFHPFGPLRRLVERQAVVAPAADGAGTCEAISAHHHPVHPPRVQPVGHAPRPNEPEEHVLGGRAPGELADLLSVDHAPAAQQLKEDPPPPALPRRLHQQPAVRELVGATRPQPHCAQQRPAIPDEQHVAARIGVGLEPAERHVNELAPPLEQLGRARVRA